MTAPLKPGTPHEHVADGYHAGLKWHVQREVGVAHPVVIVNGFIGPDYVTQSREMEGASIARVRRFVDQVIEAHAARVAKKRGRARG